MLDRTYRALADPTRRKILALLRKGDLPAGSIASHFDIAWASVSHHLSALKEADLVLVRREGQFQIYSLNTTLFQDALQHLMEFVPVEPKKNGRSRKKGSNHA